MKISFVIFFVCFLLKNTFVFSQEVNQIDSLILCSIDMQYDSIPMSCHADDGKLLFWGDNFPNPQFYNSGKFRFVSLKNDIDRKRKKLVFKMNFYLKDNLFAVNIRDESINGTKKHLFASVGSGTIYYYKYSCEYNKWIFDKVIHYGI